MGIRELLKYKTAETASVRHDNPPLDPWDQPSYVTLVARPISVHHNGHRKRPSRIYIPCCTPFPSTHCLALSKIRSDRSKILLRSSKIDLCMAMYEI